MLKALLPGHLELIGTLLLLLLLLSRFSRVWLCDPIDGSPPGFPIPGILQARTLEWAAISFSNAWKWKVKVKSPSCVRLLATPWIAAYQAPPSMGFSKQEYWSGVPLPSLIHREEYHVKMMSETVVMQLLAKEWQGSHKKLGRGKGIIFL